MIVCVVAVVVLVLVVQLDESYFVGDNNGGWIHVIVSQAVLLLAFHLTGFLSCVLCLIMPYYEYQWSIRFKASGLVHVI